MAERSDTENTLICLGPSHKTAAVELRERFALVGLRGEMLLCGIHARDDVREIVAVTTCNRSELYLCVTDPDTALPAVLEAYAEYAGISAAEVEGLLRVRENESAVGHLFRVAAGLESLVIGEAQIQGQLKQAHAAALDDGTCGPILDNLFRRALEVGKRVRRETLIGSGRASIGTAAADLVASRLGSLDGARVLVVGAGKMSGLAARCLADAGATAVLVANRRRERAIDLAEICGGEAVPFEDIDEQMLECDIVVSSTSAPHLLITRDRMVEVLEQRMARNGGSARNGAHGSNGKRAVRPLVLVDLAVPRDIDPEVADLDGCYLFDVDDLEEVVSSTISMRSNALDCAEGLVADACTEYLEWWRSQRALPAIMAMRSRAEEVRAAEVERFLRRMTHLSPDDQGAVEQLSRTIINKLLHMPTVRLRESVVDDGSEVDTRRYVDAVARLFGDRLGC